MIKSCLLSHWNSKARSKKARGCEKGNELEEEEEEQDEEEEEEEDDGEHKEREAGEGGMTTEMASLEPRGRD